MQSLTYINNDYDVIRYSQMQLVPAMWRNIERTYWQQ